MPTEGLQKGVAVLMTANQTYALPSGGIQLSWQSAAGSDMLASNDNSTFFSIGVSAANEVKTVFTSALFIKTATANTTVVAKAAQSSVLWNDPTSRIFGRAANVINSLVTVVSRQVGPVDTSFRGSCYCNVLSGTTYAMVAVIRFTDESGTTGTRIITMMTGGLVTTMQNADGNPRTYSGLSEQVRAKAGTTISIEIVGTVTNVTYNFEGFLEAVGSN